MTDKTPTQKTATTKAAKVATAEAAKGTALRVPKPYRSPKPSKS